MAAAGVIYQEAPERVKRAADGIPAPADGAETRAAPAPEVPPVRRSHESAVTSAATLMKRSTRTAITVSLLLLCSAQAHGGEGSGGGDRRATRAPALNAVKDPKTVTLHASLAFHSPAAQESARTLQAKYGAFPPVRGGGLRGGGRGGR